MAPFSAVTKKFAKVYVALDTDPKKDSVKLMQHLMDHAMEGYLLSMNEKVPSELVLKTFWEKDNE